MDTLDNYEPLDAQVTVKMQASLQKRLKEMEKVTKITTGALLRGLAESALEHFEKNKVFSFPVRVTSASGVLFGKIESAVSAHGASGTLNARIVNPQEPITKLTKRSRK